VRGEGWEQAVNDHVPSSVFSKTHARVDESMPELKEARHCKRAGQMALIEMLAFMVDLEYNWRV
jgi:hypothetical protein